MSNLAVPVPSARRSHRAGLLVRSEINVTERPSGVQFGRPFTPAVGVIFDWDSVADSVGLGAAQATLLRVSATDGTVSACCAVSIDVDNSGPSCAAGSCGDCDLNTVGPNIIDALIQSTRARGVLLSDRIRASHLSGGWGNAAADVGNVRFAHVLTPGELDLSAATPGTAAWNNLLWAQGIDDLLSALEGL